MTEVRGRTEWAGLAPGQTRPNLQILLEGDDPFTRGRRYWTKVVLNEAYSIKRVEPGRYRVLAQVGPIRLWDTSVVVRAGGVPVLDLTPKTAVAAPGALRPS